MDSNSKIGPEYPINPLPARSPLVEIYSRLPREVEHHRQPQNVNDPPESPVEEGKGLYVDIYV